MIYAIVLTPLKCVFTPAKFFSEADGDSDIQHNNTKMQRSEIMTLILILSVVILSVVYAKGPN